MDTLLFVFQFQKAHLDGKKNLVLHKLLSMFQFQSVHVEGKKNLKVDLSRQPSVSYITIAYPDAMHFVGKTHEH